ncbi:MAG: hypothetical protein FWF10_11865 [Clostridiales bacterium]|nr:hypothetical protein [Clostridiales bacterium]
MKKAKPKSAWKRVLSSKAVVIPTVIVCLLLLFVGAFYLSAGMVMGIFRAGPQNAPVTAGTPAPPTPEPTATPEPNKVIGTAIDFDPDISKMPLLQGFVSEDPEEAEFLFTREYWLDVSPEGLAEAQPGARVLRHYDTGITYLLHPSGTYPLDEARNTTGVIDLVMFDLNEDGIAELIYTISAGYDPDETCSIGMFDFTTMTRYFTDCAVRDSELAILTTEFSIELYRARIVAMDEPWGSYTLTLLEKFGDVVERNGLPVIYVD